MTKRKIAKRPVGRPRLVTDEKRAAVLLAIRLGFPPARAAQAHGLSRQTLFEHGKNHPEFLDAMKEAEAQAELSVYSRVLKHSDKQWTAAAWILERRWPARYARQDPLIHVEANASAAVATVGPPAPLGLEQLAVELKRTAEITSSVLKITVEPADGEDKDKPGRA